MLTASCRQYQWIINYAAKHNVQIMQTEIEICKQMVELLPGTYQPTAYSLKVKISALRKGVAV